RLTTNIIAGEKAFASELGSLPAVDDDQRAAAWGSRAAAGLATATAQPALDSELREKLERCPVATLSQQMRRLGLNSVSIDGVRALHPEAKMVGVAKTLRFIPGREDLFRRHG